MFRISICQWSDCRIFNVRNVMFELSSFLFSMFRNFGFMEFRIPIIDIWFESVRFSHSQLTHIRVLDFLISSFQVSVFIFRSYHNSNLPKLELSSSGVRVPQIPNIDYRIFKFGHFQFLAFDLPVWVTFSKLPFVVCIHLSKLQC